MLSPLYLSLSVLAGPICLVNLAFMFMLHNKGSLKGLKYGLLFSLACSDFFVGSIAIPLLVVTNMIENKPCKLLIATFLVNRLVSISSAIHLLAIVYERFLKIMYPFWFNIHEMTLLRSVRIVQAIWYTSLLISIIPLSWLYSERCDGKSPDNIVYTKYYDYTCMAFIILLLVLMVVAFARIYFVVRAHLSVIRVITVPPNGIHAAGMTSDLNDSARNGENDEQNITLNVTSESTFPPSEIASHRHSIAITSRSQSDPQILVGRYNQKSRRYWFIKEARVIVRFAAMVFIHAFVWGTYSVISTLEQKDTNAVDIHLRTVVSITRFLDSLFNPLVMTINNQDFHSTWANLSSCLYRVVECCRPQRQPPLKTDSRSEVPTEAREIPLICTSSV